MKKQLFVLSILFLVGCSQGTTSSNEKADGSVTSRPVADRTGELANALANGGQAPQTETKKIKVDHPNQLVPIYRVNLQVCGDLTGGKGCINNQRGQVLWGEVSEPKLIRSFGLYDVAIKSGGCVPFFKHPQPPVYRSARMPFTLHREDSPTPIVKMVRKQLTEQTLANYIEEYNLTADSGFAMMTEDTCKSIPPQQIH